MIRFVQLSVKVQCLTHIGPQVYRCTAQDWCAEILDIDRFTVVTTNLRTIPASPVSFLEAHLFLEPCVSVCSVTR